MISLAGRFGTDVDPIWSICAFLGATDSSFALNVWNSSGHDSDGGQMTMDMVSDRMMISRRGVRVYHDLSFICILSRMRGVFGVWQNRAFWGFHDHGLLFESSWMHLCGSECLCHTNKWAIWCPIPWLYRYYLYGNYLHIVTLTDSTIPLLPVSLASK